MNISVEISVGEFFDRITILEIKKDRINAPDKLENINMELDYLNALLEELPFSRSDVETEIAELRVINEKLWVIEDDIREKESQKAFDEGFIKLARDVYFVNDRRSVIKRAINLKLGSDFVEEKSYKEYS
jgi:prefoldin subunit 5